jgi:hypothetical protein
MSSIPFKLKLSLRLERQMESFVLPVRKGGLGNQMFQVAAGIVYHVEKQKTVLLPKEFYNHHNTKNIDYADTVFRAFPHRIDKVFDQDMIDRFLHQGIFTKHSISPGFDAWVPEDISGNVLLHGYFQYYPPIERHESFIRGVYLQGLQPLVSSYSPSETLVGIHVRRGDYLQYPHSEFLQTQTPTYYGNALEYFDRNKKTFLIFSDDLEWCKQQKVFQDLPNKLFIDEPDECKSLAIMTMCHGGFICANSTFSWWGAFLGAYEKRQPVIAPLHWFKGEQIQLFPKGWILL